MASTLWRESDFPESFEPNKQRGEMHFAALLGKLALWATSENTDQEPVPPMSYNPPNRYIYP